MLKNFPTSCLKINIKGFEENSWEMSLKIVAFPVFITYFVHADTMSFWLSFKLSTNSSYRTLYNAICFLKNDIIGLINTGGINNAKL